MENGAFRSVTPSQSHCFDCYAFGFFVVNIQALYIEDALTVVYMLVYKSLLFA